MNTNEFHERLEAYEEALRGHELQEQNLFRTLAERGYPSSREEFEEGLREHGINPEFQWLHCAPTRERLVDILVALDEVRSDLRFIGYETWAGLLDPVASLLDAECNKYPEEEKPKSGREVRS